MTPLLLALVVPAEAAKRKPPPDVVEDALAYATTDRAKAVALLEQALADATSKARDTVTVYVAEQHRIAGNRDEAHRHFATVVERGVKSPDLTAARLGLALIEAQGGVDERVVGLLDDPSEKEVLKTQNADRFLLLAIEAARRSDTREVAVATRKALAYAEEDPEVLARVQATLEALAKGEPLPEPDAGDPIVRAEEAWAAGDRELATRLAEKAAANATDPVAKARADGLLRVLRAPPEDTDRIAVLLPLTGKFESVGKQVRDALEFGYAGAPRSLVFVDTGATPEGAVAALEKAVLEEGAIGVVGPLLTEETDAVLAAAEALHVPLLSLSQSYEDTTGHHWALQAMYTRADQVEALLDYVFEQKQMRSFAMFSPDNPFGQHAAELFAEGVKTRGGTITTQATYSAEEQNLLPFAQKLGTRVGNLAELRRQAEERGGNAATVVLPPKIDFQGLFLPETSARTPLACAALAYEEFPMGAFTPTKGGPLVPLLGLSSWNTTGLVAAGNEYTRNSLFPDVFSFPVAGDADPFVVAYRARTNRTPTALEAATVDAGKLLASAARSDADTRAEFREALLDATAPDAVTGATAFHDDDLRVKRRMLILTINRTTIDDVGTVEL